MLVRDGCQDFRSSDNSVLTSDFFIFFRKQLSFACVKLTSFTSAGIMDPAISISLCKDMPAISDDYQIALAGSSKDRSH